MKTRRFIVVLLFGLALLVSCAPKAPEPVEGPTAIEGPTITDYAFPELSAIDSVMWQRPDSAFAVLRQFAASPKADSLDSYNGHYFYLLLSELLYKNDYAQTNRAELQQAVAYFDSLVLVDTRDADTQRASAENTPPAVVFLAARSHYMNGVSHYEQGQIAKACAEYLKALETMENHFLEKDLVGKKARFMALTYNRLGELFSAQYMMEPAISCCEQSLAYTKIAPTSPFGVSNTLYRLGLQYDKLGEKETAREYYEQALETLPVFQGPIYRDIVATKALCDYQLGVGMELPMDALRQILAETTDDSERLTRYLTIGDIFFEKKLYDSAVVYLEPVFERNENLTRQIQAADFLRIIYDSLGYKDKVDACVHFLANKKKSEGENKALVSQLESLFQSYLNQKQEKKAAQEKREAVLRTEKILVPIALVVAAVIIGIIRKRGKKHLTQQQQAHRMEQAALSGRLKRSNEKLRDVSKQLEQSLAKHSATETEAPDDYSAFLNAPICLYIVRLVHEGQFKAKIDYLIYKDSALSKEQLLALRNAAGKQLPRFVLQTRKQYPNLTDNDMDFCYLFLLGLNEADISALMQRAYTTVCDRSRKISRIIGANDSLYQTLRGRLSE